MRRLSNKAFTLIEVLVGAIVVGAISLSAWTAVSVLTKTGEMSRHRSMAVNILQQSQEEVRRIAQVDVVYDTLGTCQFPHPVNAVPNTCGLEDLDVNDASLGLSDFTRSMTVTLENGSPELKRIQTVVQWMESGVAKQIQSIILLSRPPAPLPGNIHGLVVSSAQPGVPLNGIPIVASANFSTATYTRTSTGVLDADSANFDFADVNTGRHLLPIGDYSITVNASGYEPYVHGVVTVGSENQTFVDIELIPLPDDAVISGNVIDSNTNLVVPTFNSARIHRYKDGASQAQVNGSTAYTFTIPFLDASPQSFTINTRQAFRAGFTYLVNSAGGASCSHKYNFEGFSTSVVQADDSLICTNNYRGNLDGSSDRITVFPGDNISLDLKVVPVPELQITGRVEDSDGAGIFNAVVYARWPRNMGSHDWRKNNTRQTVRTDVNGDFVFNVPAVQEMWANGSWRDYLQVWARGSVSVLGCCDLPQNQSRNSQTEYVDSLAPAGSSIPISTLVISNADDDCGDVGGDIIDDSTANNLSGVNVTIAVSDITDGVGHYDIVCPAGQTGYRLRERTYRFTGQKNGYYTNDSNGNSQYLRRTGNGRDVSIQADQKIDYDARMWPRGYGNIQVTVMDRTTMALLDGVDVSLSPYSGSSTTVTTVAGVGDFTNVPETWPPPGLPADYYNQNSRTHTIRINHDPANYEPYVQSIILDDGQTLSITILLEPIGGA